MKKLPIRSGETQAALARRAPTMDHRNEPRGGATNESLNLQTEAIVDLDETEVDLHDDGDVQVIVFEDAVDEEEG